MDSHLVWAIFYTTVIIRILRMLEKQLGCNLMLDWIHHKFLKLNFLRKSRSYVQEFIANLILRKPES